MKVEVQWTDGPLWLPRVLRWLGGTLRISISGGEKE